ncbi:flavoprotein [Embleya sp. NPDC005971]|uniref:flavoprotein n=1 Tax=Embleya sp. NPDC005971 TaxID=3156724 RepID=UPI0033FEFE9E
MSDRVLYLVVCAAGPAPQVGVLVEAAKGRGWDVCTIATPAAEGGGFVDPAAIEAVTGRPVRHRYRRADEPGRWPKADAVAVAPMTMNTVTKWADGHADTYALGVLTEAIGLGLPIAALPFWNAAQAAHPAVDRAVATLRECGVEVLYGTDGFRPHPPGTGGSRIPTYPWVRVLDALDRRAAGG